MSEGLLTEQSCSRVIKASNTNQEPITPRRSNQPLKEVDDQNDADSQPNPGQSLAFTVGKRMVSCEDVGVTGGLKQESDHQSNKADCASNPVLHSVRCFGPLQR